MTDLPYDKMVNTSLLQTMTRSVNTLATVLITLLALYFFGGDTLKNFAFALMVGVTSGAYSSIFIASPLLVLWKNSNDRKRAAVRRGGQRRELSPVSATSAPAASRRRRRLADAPQADAAEAQAALRPAAALSAQARRRRTSRRRPTPTAASAC